MAGLGLYLAGLDAAEARQLRADLADIAKRHGYTAERGPTAGQGNVATMLVAIASGEVATVLLADEPRAAAIRELRRQAALADDHLIREAFGDIANALLESVRREWPDGDDPWGLL